MIYELHKSKTAFQGTKSVVETMSRILVANGFLLTVYQLAIALAQAFGTAHNASALIVVANDLIGKIYAITSLLASESGPHFCLVGAHWSLTGHLTVLASFSLSTVRSRTSAQQPCSLRPAESRQLRHDDSLPGVGRDCCQPQRRTLDRPLYLHRHPQFATLTSKVAPSSGLFVK